MRVLSPTQREEIKERVMGVCILSSKDYRECFALGVDACIAFFSNFGDEYLTGPKNGEDTPRVK